MRGMRAALAGAALVAASLGFGGARAAEVDVTSPEGLAQALAQAGPGTVIRLGPGDYGTLSLRRLSGGPDAPVVLRSADPARPARFSGMDLRGVAHLDLRDLVFDYERTSDGSSRDRPFTVTQSRDVEIGGALFDGDDAPDGSPTGVGLRVVGVDGFTIEDSEIRGFYRGLQVNRSGDVTVRGNDVHSIRMDGMNFAQLAGALIEGNYIHDFDRVVDSGDHADMIQFWTNKTGRPSTDITIRGNLLNSGGGWFTQSIFMRNEEVDQGRAGREMFYRNIRIEDNVIINAQLHGITVGAADGLVIANNSVLRNATSEGPRDNPALWTPRINVAEASTDVRIERNVVARIEGGDGLPGWTVADNLLVQDREPSGPGFYGRVFAGMPGGDPRDPRSFAPRPGGPLDGTGIGAALLTRAAP
jgi:hypothetical protein